MSRRKSQPAPPHVLFKALAEPDRDPSRPWLLLSPGEVRPLVLHAEPPRLLVWSSLWQRHPGAQVRLDLAAQAVGSGTDLTWTLLLAEPAESAEEVRSLRRRLDELINRDLRDTFDA